MFRRYNCGRQFLVANALEVVKIHFFSTLEPNPDVCWSPNGTVWLFSRATPKFPPQNAKTPLALDVKRKLVIYLHNFHVF